MSSDDESPVYALRVMDTARADIVYAHTRMMTFAGEAVADDWLAEFEEALSHLATNPVRPLALESALFPTLEVRAFTFRRTGSQVAYRVLFMIREDTLDGPQVWVLHVRHGSAAPIQGYEARNIEADLEGL